MHLYISENYFVCAITLTHSLRLCKLHLARHKYTLRSKLLCKLSLSVINMIFFYFSIKLMDGVVPQCSLDQGNQSQTPVIISLPGEPN